MLEGPVQMQRLVRKYLDDGRAVEALVVAKKGENLFPSFVVDFRLLLAEAYVAGGRIAEARALLEAEQCSHGNDKRIQEALDGLRL